MTPRYIVALALTAAVTVVAVSVLVVPTDWRSGDSALPTARVKRGDVDTSVHAVGELKTSTATLLTAPAAGTDLRILSLKPTGSEVRANEIVLTFDPSEQEEKLAEQRAALQEAELEIQRLEAVAAVEAAQAKVNLLTARFDVRKAELGTRGNELLSAIEARQNELTLEEARRRLVQLEEDAGSYDAANRATMATLVETRRKAAISVRQAQSIIDAMVVRAPMDGVMSVLGNREGVTYSYTGVMLPEFREGDGVSSGASVAEILGMNQLTFVARVPEAERPNVVIGQRATLAFDGAADTTFTARVLHIGMLRGGIAATESASRRFDVVLKLEGQLPATRPGLTSKVQIASAPLRDVLYLPRQAIFYRNGKAHVYVRTASEFQERKVIVAAHTESTAVVTGLAEGTEVALANPTRRGQASEPE